MQSNGYSVMGWQAVKDTETGEIKIDTNNNLSRLQIMSPENLNYPPAATTAAMFEGNIDSNDVSINSENGKVVTFEFYDNKGYTYTAKFSIKSTEKPNEFNITLKQITNSNGEVLNDEIFEKIEFGEEKTATLNFDKATGNITGNTMLDLSFEDVPGAEAFENIKIDFSTVTSYNTNGLSTINASKGDKNSFNTGRSVGEMTGVAISNNGLISATYSNGQTKILGQIASAQFSNASGLSHEGDNLYTQTLNSGNAKIQDITISGGYISTGVLEMSNVDLSKEFTDMIITQRGFQANSRIITVSDTMLEELTNLKR